MLLTDELSRVVGDAFAAEGFEAWLGLVRLSDRPDLAQFQCNGALAAARAAKANPRAVGEKIAARLKESDLFSDVALAGPGFINLTVKDEALASRADAVARDGRLGAWTAQPGEKIILDYGGPTSPNRSMSGICEPPSSANASGICWRSPVTTSSETFISATGACQWGS